MCRRVVQHQHWHVPPSPRPSALRLDSALAFFEEPSELELVGGVPELKYWLFQLLSDAAENGDCVPLAVCNDDWLRWLHPRLGDLEVRMEPTNS